MWQEKYAEYCDVSNINSFADTLISYATMWYQPASRAERGEWSNDKGAYSYTYRVPFMAIY